MGRCCRFVPPTLASHPPGAGIHRNPVGRRALRLPAQPLIRGRRRRKASWQKRHEAAQAQPAAAKRCARRRSWANLSRRGCASTRRSWRMRSGWRRLPPPRMHWRIFTGLSEGRTAPAKTQRPFVRSYPRTRPAVAMKLWASRGLRWPRTNLRPRAAGGTASGSPSERDDEPGPSAPLTRRSTITSQTRADPRVPRYLPLRLRQRGARRRHLLAQFCP